MSRPPVADYIARLVPYVPGKPIEELERELGVTDSIKIASNENPLGPSPLAVKALRAAAKDLHRYPDGNATLLRAKLAAKLGVNPAMLVFGNGSNEVLELLVATLMQPGDHAVISDHAFVVYDLAVDSRGLAKTVVPAGKHFGHDLRAMAKAVTDQTRLLFIANPNNPTGTMAGKAELDELLESLPERVIVVLDEAYFEYVDDPDYPNGVELVKRGARVAVTRTFSKVYGLAGLRMGYGVMDEELAGYLNRVRQPFNTNTLGQVAALAALDDDAFVEKSRRTNRRGLLFLYREFRKLGIKFIKSRANFVLFQSPVDAQELYTKLLHKGVIVRPMGGYRLPDWLRVTAGTTPENRRFIAALKECL